jgi:hypothetical protein
MGKIEIFLDHCGLRGMAARMSKKVLARFHFASWSRLEIIELVGWRWLECSDNGRQEEKGLHGLRGKQKCGGGCWGGWGLATRGSRRVVHGGRCSTAAQKRRRQVVHVARVVRAGREREMSCVGPER